MLRDVTGVPAWAVALKNSNLSPYTLELLQVFVQQHPQDYKVLLERSLANISPYSRHEYLSALQGLSPQFQDIVTVITQTLRQPQTTTDYHQALATWKKTKPGIANPIAYCKYLMQGDKRKQLIELNNSEDVLSMQCVLEKYARNTSRPVFYIDSPEDLVCSAPFIKRNDKEGVFQAGPGG
jgi:hypothetical protein